MIDGRRLLDAFLFRNEVDLLELRLRELDGLVDLTLVVQSTETHAGTPKPLVFDTADPRWAPWCDRIVSVEVPRLPLSASRWDREHAARDTMTGAVQGYSDADTDLVLISDVDEIPDPAAVRQMAPYVTADAWVGFRPVLYQYYLNLRAPQAWSGIALASVATVRRIGCQAIRDQRKAPPIGVKRSVGGWHFSFLGGVAGIQEKVAAYTHDEFDTPYYRDPVRLAQRIADRTHPFDKRPGRCWLVPVSELPRDVQAHPERYAHLLLPQEMAI